MATTEEIVAQYEEMFSKRFTNEDEEYMKTVNKPQASPPCLTDWINTGYRDRYTVILVMEQFYNAFSLRCICLNVL